MAGTKSNGALEGEAGDFIHDMNYFTGLNVLRQLSESAERIKRPGKMTFNSKEP